MLLLVLATVVLAGGCAARLVPAPGAITAPGRGAGAIAEVEGVRVVARARVGG